MLSFGGGRGGLLTVSLARSETVGYQARVAPMRRASEDIEPTVTRRNWLKNIIIYLRDVCHMGVSHLLWNKGNAQSHATGQTERHKRPI